MDRVGPFAQATRHEAKDPGAGPVQRTNQAARNNIRKLYGNEARGKAPVAASQG